MHNHPISGHWPKGIHRKGQREKAIVLSDFYCKVWDSNVHFLSIIKFDPVFFHAPTASILSLVRGEGKPLNPSILQSRFICLLITDFINHCDNKNRHTSPLLTCLLIYKYLLICYVCTEHTMYV